MCSECKWLKISDSESVATSDVSGHKLVGETDAVSSLLLFSCDEAIIPGSFRFEHVKLVIFSVLFSEVWSFSLPGKVSDAIETFSLLSLISSCDVEIYQYGWEIIN